MRVRIIKLHTEYKSPPNTERNAIHQLSPPLPPPTPRPHTHLQPYLSPPQTKNLPSP